MVRRMVVADLAVLECWGLCVVFFYRLQAEEQLRKVLVGLVVVQEGAGELLADKPAEILVRK